MINRVNTNKVSVKNDDIVPPGLMDFFTIKPVMKEEKGTLKEGLLDQTIRKFKVIAIFTRSNSVNETITFDNNTKNGTSYIRIEDKGFNSLVFDDSDGNEFFGTLNQNNELSSLNVTIEAPNRVFAIGKFDVMTQPILDSMSFTANCPILIQRVVCIDIDNMIETYSYVVPYKVQKLNLIENKIDKTLMPIYALYREAKNNISPFYKFLCYHKILEGIYRNLRPLLVKHVRDLKIKFEFEKEVVPNDKRIKGKLKLEIGKNIKNVWQNVLRPEYRNLIAHYNMDDGNILNVSSFLMNYEFNTALVLLEICVRIVVENQTKYQEKLRELNKSN